MARSRGGRRLFFNADRKNGEVLAEINGAINERVNKIFALDESAAGGRCPGESDCTKGFRSAAGRNREEKEKEACIGINPNKPICPLFPTKPKAADKPNTNAEILINRLEVIRQHRLSGYPLAKDEMTFLEFEALIVYEMTYNHARIQCENRTRQYLESNLEMTQMMIRGMPGKK